MPPTAYDFELMYLFLRKSKNQNGIQFTELSCNLSIHPPVEVVYYAMKIAKSIT